MTWTNQQLCIIAAATSIAFSSQAPCAAIIHCRPNHFPGSSIAFTRRDATTKLSRRRCWKWQEEGTTVQRDQNLGCAPYFSSPFSIRRNRIDLQSTTGHQNESGTSIGVETAVGEEWAPLKNSRRLLPSNILGPPEPLRSLKIGQCLDAFRVLPPSSILLDDVGERVTRTEDGDDDKLNNCVDRLKFTMERASETPDIFLLRNFLTSLECQRIQSMARHNNNTQRSPAGTISRERDERARKNCLVAWLPSLPSAAAKFDDEMARYNDVIPNLVASASNILLTPSILSHPTAGVEDLQVLEYGPGGEFVLHHDGESRILTVLYYLNGVGGTWFPLADVAVDDADAIERRKKSWSMPNNRKEALDLIECRNMTPGKNGLLIRGTTKCPSGEKTVHDALEAMDDDSDDKHVIEINAGDAIAFYNCLDDGSGRFDWRSIHCGLPTSEEDHVRNKWVANHWFRLNYLDGME